MNFEKDEASSKLYVFATIKELIKTEPLDASEAKSYVPDGTVSEDIKSDMKYPGWATGDYQTIKNMKEGFRKGIPPSEAKELFNEVVKETLEIEDKFKSKMKKKKKSPSFDDGELDLDRVLGGTTDYFIKKNKKEIPLARIGINTTFSAETETDEIKDSVIQGARYYYYYRRMGIPCEIMAMVVSGNDMGDYSYSVHEYLLKRGDEKIDLMKLVAFLCSPAILRYYYFMIQEYLAIDINSKVKPGRGTPIRETSKVKEVLADRNRFDIII